jgi:hypothetical protein
MLHLLSRGKRQFAQQGVRHAGPGEWSCVLQDQVVIRLHTETDTVDPRTLPNCVQQQRPPSSDFSQPPAIAHLGLILIFFMPIRHYFGSPD